MNPQVGQPQNPFMQLLSKLQSQGAPQAPGQNNPMIQALMQRSTNPAGASQPGGAPIGGAGAPQGAGQPTGLPGVSAQQPDIQDASIPGQNPGISKNLLAAMNQLHGAITAMTDPQEIRMIRSILVLLNQLIVKDQETQNQRTGQMQPSQPGQSQLSAGDMGAQSQQQPPQHAGFPMTHSAGQPA